MAESRKAAKETTEDFSNRIMQYLNATGTAYCISLGYKLGLFKILSSFSEPKTSQEISEAGAFKERYIREWLACLTMADIVNYNPTDRTYFLPEHRRPVLKAKDERGSGVQTLFMPPIYSNQDQVAKCFRKDGPQGTEEAGYVGITEALEQETPCRLESVSRYFQQVPGLIEKLEAGIDVCDVGCASGVTLLYIASQFPKSRFVGCDISVDEIAKAKEKANNSKLQNISFMMLDVCEMSPDWTATFDHVISVLTIHDIPHATIAVQEIYRLLKPGGIFSLVELDVHSKLEDNYEIPVMPFKFALSVGCCLPVSMNTEGSEGLGCVWGQENALEMLTKVGFKNCKLVAIGGFFYITAEK